MEVMPYVLQTIGGNCQVECRQMSIYDFLGQLHLTSLGVRPKTHYYLLVQNRAHNSHVLCTKVQNLAHDCTNSLYCPVFFSNFLICNYNRCSLSLPPIIVKIHATRNDEFPHDCKL